MSDFDSNTIAGYRREAARRKAAADSERATNVRRRDAQDASSNRPATVTPGTTRSAPLGDWTPGKQREGNG
jgi:hypothetical protein